MSERRTGIMDKISKIRAEETKSKELLEAQKLRIEESNNRQKEDEISRRATALRESFLTLYPVIVPFLQEIADEYRDEKGQALSHPKVDTFEPLISGEGSRSGHCALIWGTPIPRIMEKDGRKVSLVISEAFDKYTRTKLMLDPKSDLSIRQRREHEDLLRMYGSKEVIVSGFNTIVFVADTEEDFSRNQVPVLWLAGTDIPRTRIQQWFENTRITDINSIAPILTIALDHATNLGTVTTSLAEFISSGTKIRSIVPFV